MQGRSGKVETCLVLADTASPEGRLSRVPGRVHAEGGTRGGSPAAPCPATAAAHLLLDPVRQLDPAQGDGREPLNLLSSILLLQAVLAWLACFKQLMEREDGFFSYSTLGDAWWEQGWAAFPSEARVRTSHVR